MHFLWATETTKNCQITETLDLMKQVTHMKLVSLVDWIIDHATSSSQLILTKASEWGPLCVFFVGERVFRAEIMADEVFWMIRWWRVLVTKRACRLLFVSSITGTGATLTYTKYKIHKCKIQNKKYKIQIMQYNTNQCCMYAATENPLSLSH